MSALLDVNVLVALLAADPADHRRARAWLETGIAPGWASCAIPQNGCELVVSQSRDPSPVSVAAAIERLERATLFLTLDGAIALAAAAGAGVGHLAVP